MLLSVSSQWMVSTPRLGFFYLQCLEWAWHKLDCGVVTPFTLSIHLFLDDKICYFNKQINKSSMCVRATWHLLPGPTRRVIHVYQQPLHACGHLHMAHACTHRCTPSPLYPYAELIQKVLDAYSTKAPPLPNPPELKGTWKTMWSNAFPHRSLYRRENQDAERDSEPVRALMETIMS